MILVAVRDHEALHFAVILFQIRDIRQHDVDAEHVVLREGHAAVDDDDAVAVLDRGNIHTDLFEPSERDHLHLFLFPCFFIPYGIRPAAVRGIRFTAPNVIRLHTVFPLLQILLLSFRFFRFAGFTLPGLS